MIEKLREGIKFIGIIVACFIGLIVLSLACLLVAKKIILPIIEKMGA